MKYQLLFSIPIHERLEVVVDQVLNIKHCNPSCAIVFHLSQGYKDANSSLTKESFIQIIEKIGDVYLNPVSVRTGMDDIIQAHLENYKYAKSIIDFEYFCICASNELFFKKDPYDYIQMFDAGVYFYNVSGWSYKEDFFKDYVFSNYLHSKSIEAKSTHPEGIFFKKQIFDYIFDEIETFFDHTVIDVLYPRDEVYFSSIVFDYIKSHPDTKIGIPFTYSAYHFSHLWDVTRLRIVSDISKKYNLFSAKRVDRNINDGVRAYLRQNLGYLEEEECLLGDYCKIKKYPFFIIDFLDVKKIVVAILSNYKVVFKRVKHMFKNKRSSRNG